MISPCSSHRVQSQIGVNASPLRLATIFDATEMVRLDPRCYRLGISWVAVRAETA